MTKSHPLRTSSIATWKDVPTESVGVAGTTFVYRQLGPASGIPVIMLNHWGATLDNFDPRIVDGLAASRPVLAIPLIERNSNEDYPDPQRHADP